MRSIAFVVAMALLITPSVLVLGALAEDDEFDRTSAGQTGQVQYVTSEGTVTVDLPDGFYLILKSYIDELELWAIETAKTDSDCTYIPALTAGDESVDCPGHIMKIVWGKNGEPGYGLEDSIDGMKNEIGGDGSYTETASGETAWLIAGNEDTESNGFYGAVIDYSDDENKWMQVVVVKITEEGSPSESMTPEEFKSFIESISIEK